VLPARDNHGLVGRTIGAAVLTLGDFERQMVLTLVEHASEALLGPPSVRIGGLRSGWGGTVHGKLVLHGYSYIPGVTVSGKISSAGTRLRIGGSAAVHGAILLNAHGTLTGALGGQRVHASAPRSTGLGLSVSTSALQSRLSSLLASPRQLADFGESGSETLLRYMLGAPS
jgi:hypothetical protein